MHIIHILQPWSCCRGFVCGKLTSNLLICVSRLKPLLLSGCLDENTFPDCDWFGDGRPAAHTRRSLMLLTSLNYYDERASNFERDEEYVSCQELSMTALPQIASKKRGTFPLFRLFPWPTCRSYACLQFELLCCSSNPIE